MDLAQLAGVASRVGAAPDLRAGDRLSVSTRLLLPLLNASGVAPSELANDLRAAANGRAAATLVLPAGAGQAAARLEVGGRLFLLPPALRDALLTALARENAVVATTTPAAANAGAPTAAAPTAAPAQATTTVLADASRAWAVAAQTTAAAAGVVGGSGAPRAVHRARDDGPPPAVRFEQPILEPVTETRAAAATGERLRHAVERSGLFFESHVAQWAGGQRDAAELRSEALRLMPAGESAQRVAAQVALLQEGTLRLEGPAWPGQPMTLSIQREDAALPSQGAGASEPVFSAHLTLDLPHLGAVDVVLRLSGEAVSATVGSTHAPQIAPALGELADQLSARGLRPVLLQSVAADAQVP